MEFQEKTLTLSREEVVGNFVYMMRHTHQADTLTTIEMTVHKTDNGIQRMLGTLAVEYGQLRVVNFEYDADISNHFAYLSDYYEKAKRLVTQVTEIPESPVFEPSNT